MHFCTHLPCPCRSDSAPPCHMVETRAFALHALPIVAMLSLIVAFAARDDPSGKSSDIVNCTGDLDDRCARQEVRNAGVRNASECDRHPKYRHLYGPCGERVTRDGSGHDDDELPHGPHAEALPALPWKTAQRESAAPPRDREPAAVREVNKVVSTTPDVCNNLMIGGQLCNQLWMCICMLDVATEGWSVFTWLHFGAGLMTLLLITLLDIWCQGAAYSVGLWVVIYIGPLAVVCLVPCSIFFTGSTPGPCEWKAAVRCSSHICFSIYVLYAYYALGVVTLGQRDLTPDLFCDFVHALSLLLGVVLFGTSFFSDILGILDTDLLPAPLTPQLAWVDDGDVDPKTPPGNKARDRWMPSADVELEAVVRKLF